MSARGVKCYEFAAVQAKRYNPNCRAINDRPYIPNVRSSFKFQLWLSAFISTYSIMTTKAPVFLSGAPAESKGLRISFTFAVQSMPRSFDALRIFYGMIASGNHRHLESLRLLRMTALYLVALHSRLIKTDSHNSNLSFSPNSKNSRAANRPGAFLRITP